MKSKPLKLLNIICLLIISINTTAQDPTVKSLQTEVFKKIKITAADTIKNQWLCGGLFTMNINQGSLSNWSAGGDEFSLSMNSYINGYAYFKEDKHRWENNLDIFLGYIKTTSLGTRKNDDRLDFLSKYGYAVSPKFSVASLVNLRTQLFDGYSYVNDSTKNFSSTFLSPAYLLVSPGIDYRPIANFSIFLSPITSRLVIIKNERIAMKGYYADPYHQYKEELGAFATISYSTDPIKIVTYKTRLDLFSNYRNKPENIDIFMQNIFTAKLFKMFALTWNVDIIYDDDAKLFGENLNEPRTQLKSLFGLGFRVKL